MRKRITKGMGEAEKVEESTNCSYPINNVIVGSCADRLSERIVQVVIGKNELEPHELMQKTLEHAKFALWIAALRAKFSIQI